MVRVRDGARASRTPDLSFATLGWLMMAETGADVGWKINRFIVYERPNAQQWCIWRCCRLVFNLRDVRRAWSLFSSRFLRRSCVKNFHDSNLSMSFEFETYGESVSFIKNILNNRIKFVLIKSRQYYRLFTSRIFQL